MSLKKTIIAGAISSLAACAPTPEIQGSILSPSLPTKVEAVEAPVQLPATLLNWYHHLITDTAYLRGKPLVSTSTDDCEFTVRPKPSYASEDLAYLRELTSSDLEVFGGVFPELSLSIPKIKPASDKEYTSAVPALIKYGADSQEYKAATAKERQFFEGANFSLFPGIPTVHSFSRVLSELVYDINHGDRSEYTGQSFSVNYSSLTGSLISIDGVPAIISSAHGFVDDDSLYTSDIAIVGKDMLNMEKVDTSEVYESEVHPSIQSSELVGKDLKLYFYRYGCADDTTSGKYFVYDIKPTVYDASTDQLLANAPADFGRYMGGVSGAGVYLDGKLVGIFKGREKLNGGLDTAYLRFVGVDSIWKAIGKSRSSREGIVVL